MQKILVQQERTRTITETREFIVEIPTDIYKAGYDATQEFIDANFDAIDEAAWGIAWDEVDDEETDNDLTYHGTYDLNDTATTAAYFKEYGEVVEVKTPFDDGQAWAELLAIK